MLIRIKENTFAVTFQNGSTSNFIKGTGLFDILNFLRPDAPNDIVLAKVNNKVLNLHESLEEDCTLAWLKLGSIEGRRSYQQSLCLVLIRAMRELNPRDNLLIDHSLGKGLYCEVKNLKSVSGKWIKRVKNRMQEIIENDEPIIPEKWPRQKALDHLRSYGEDPMWQAGNPEVIRMRLYRCGPLIEYLGYPLLPRTGYLQTFNLYRYSRGFILYPPRQEDIGLLPKHNHYKKLFRVFHEYGQWQNILGASKASEVNKSIVDKSIFDLIKIAEGLHEKRFTQIADRITKKKKDLRIILVAGPSSSGKTTFAKRLGIQLKVNGLKPVAISLDDYFVDRNKTPVDHNGDYDFESLRAINVERFNSDLKDLLAGRKVELPRYDFVEGKSVTGPTWQLKPDQPILVEGLHALNEKLTTQIPQRSKYRIFVSALTQLNLTNHTRIPTSDVRLLRRLIRGKKFRGHDASATLQQWKMVRMGEEKYIFPFQELADTIFNSSLVYELNILRALSKSLLEEVSVEDPYYPEAQRILELLLCFLPVPHNVVPLNSILREFIGGSSFYY